MQSRTEENYLKTIYHLCEKSSNDFALLGDIARELNITPGTVTQMMKNLTRQDLIIYQSRQGVKLTQQGEQGALLIIRRHRLIETFLVKIMSIDWAHVHEEAEELEHVISDRLLYRMDEMLDHPKYDPHGAPIPSSAGVLTHVNYHTLSICILGQYKLVHMSGSSKEFLNWCQKNSLLPGTRIELIEIDTFAETYTLIIQQQENIKLTIGKGSAEKLHVIALDQSL